MFNVGQKIVCVNNSNQDFRDGWYPGSKPQLNCIYTVREIGVTLLGYEGLRVEGLYLSGKSSRIGKYHDLFYRASRFRPLIDRSTRKSRQAVIDKLLADSVKQSDKEKA